MFPLTMPMHKPRENASGTLLSRTSWPYNGYKNKHKVMHYISSDHIKTLIFETVYKALGSPVRHLSPNFCKRDQECLHL